MARFLQLKRNPKMAFSRPDVRVTEDLPCYFPALSLKVYEVLEDLGASVEMRRIKMDMCTNYEILRTVHSQPNLSCNIFGSCFEGTSMFGMKSDIDHVVTINDLPVVTDAADHPEGTCLLIVEDKTTLPGYCKLQVVHNGNALKGKNPEVASQLPGHLQDFFKFSTDKNDRLVCSFNPPSALTQDFHRRQGPALSMDETLSVGPTDFVIALKCNKWPDSASEWLTRLRHFQWPSSEMIKLCETYGCMFVPVAHPHSDEPELLWRISFSQQERLLMTSFNPVQLKCYTLLKMIKKEFIAPFVPDSLSSYHIKTSIFYLIENTQSDFWNPKNLLGCIVASLTLLSKWTETGICPNYFTAAANMFVRNVHGDVKEQLHHRLQVLLLADCKYLANIKTEDFGIHLEICCDSSVVTARKMYLLDRKNLHQKRTKLSVQLKQLEDIFQTSMYYISNELDEDTELSLQALLIKLRELRYQKPVLGYTKEQTKRAITPCLPYIELSIMSGCVALAVKQDQQSEQNWSYLASDCWNMLSLQSDSFSAKLKQATVMYTLGYYNPSLYILTSLSSLVRFTLCTCYRERNIHPLDNGLIETLQQQENVTTQDLLSNMVIPCVYFLPAEKELTPIALCYEMIRKDDTQSRQGNNVGDSFSDWALVDAQFLLHFLLYLNHEKLNMDADASEDVDNMEMLTDARGISHRDTCLNLLGWVYLEQGRINRAMECFRKSQEVKPYWNAAVLHIKEAEAILDHLAGQT